MMAAVGGVAVPEEHQLRCIVDIKIVAAFSLDGGNRIERTAVFDGDAGGGIGAYARMAEVEQGALPDPGVLDLEEIDGVPGVGFVGAPFGLDVDAQIFNADQGAQPGPRIGIDIGLRLCAEEMVEERGIDGDGIAFDAGDAAIVDDVLAAGCPGQIDAGLSPAVLIPGAAPIDGLQPALCAGVIDDNIIPDRKGRCIADLETAAAGQHAVGNDVAPGVGDLVAPAGGASPAGEQHRALVRAVPGRPQDGAGRRILAITGAAQDDTVETQLDGAADLVFPRAQLQCAAKARGVSGQQPDLEECVLDVGGVVSRYRGDAFHDGNPGQGHAAALIAGVAEIWDAVALRVRFIDQTALLECNDLRFPGQAGGRMDQAEEKHYPRHGMKISFY